MKWQEVPEEIREEFSESMRAMYGAKRIVDRTGSRRYRVQRKYWQLKHRLGFHTLVNFASYDTTTGAHQYQGLRCLICGR